jgi:hypothetical protein
MIDVTTTTDPIFESAHSAALFAHRFSTEQYGRSAMSRMMTGPTGTGKGLAGIDGAGQAGMIRRLVQGLGPLHEAIIVARFSPREMDCACGSACCSGKFNNLEWAAAVRKIGEFSITATPCAVSNLRLRCGVVAKHFGIPLNIGELADQCEVHRNTASKHASLILAWLRGKPAKGQHPAVTGEEAKALMGLHDVLQAARLVP